MEDRAVCGRATEGKREEMESEGEGKERDEKVKIIPGQSREDKKNVNRVWNRRGRPRRVYQKTLRI